ASGVIKVHKIIPVWVIQRGQNSTGFVPPIPTLKNCANPSLVTHLVKPLISNNRIPSFFAHALTLPISCQGRQCSRYCLTCGRWPFPIHTSDSKRDSADAMPDCLILDRS